MKYKFEDIAINSTIKKKPEESDKYNYIGLEHLEPGNLFIQKYGSEVAPIGEKLVMKKGDVLFGKRRAYQKKVAIAPCDGIFSAHGMVLRPNETIINKEYFPFFISSDKFLNEAIKISVGSLSPTINWRDLKELEFNLPPIEEQERLAKLLWTAYELKESYKKLITATDEMVKAQFIEMFGESETENNKWPLIKIVNLCDVRGGSTPSRSINKYWENGNIPWFTIDDIRKQGRIITDADQKITEEALTKTFLFPENTIFICCTASVGEYALTKTRMASNQQFNGLMIRNRNELSPIYLMYHISLLKNYLLSVSGKTTIDFISKTQLENIAIILPPMKLQNTFETIYYHSEQSKAELQKSIADIDNVMKSLLP